MIKTYDCQFFEILNLISITFLIDIKTDYLPTQYFYFYFFGNFLWKRVSWYFWGEKFNFSTQGHECAVDGTFEPDSLATLDYSIAYFYVLLYFVWPYISPLFVVCTVQRFFPPIYCEHSFERSSPQCFLALRAIFHYYETREERDWFTSILFDEFSFNL